MSKALPILLSTLALALLPLAPRTSAAAPRQDLEKRVSELEGRLAQESAAHQETRKLLEETLTYLHAQAKGAEGMLSTLDRSEDLGFTKGINFQSREVLLAGLREYWKTTEKGLPALPRKKKAAEPPAPARR